MLAAGKSLALGGHRICTIRLVWELPRDFQK